MAQPAYRTKYEDQLAQVLRDLNVPLLAYTAMAKDEYCKPAIGMWQYFTTKDNKFDIDRTKSVFVGDAAGRTFTFASRGPDFDVYDRGQSPSLAGIRIS